MFLGDSDDATQALKDLLLDANLLRTQVGQLWKFPKLQATFPTKSAAQGRIYIREAFQHILGLLLDGKFTLETGDPTQPFEDISLPNNAQLNPGSVIYISGSPGAGTSPSPSPWFPLLQRRALYKI